MKKLYCLLALAVLSLMNSCESVFPDDNLDNYWKLRKVEFRSGYDFSGVPCQSKEVTDYMFGFSRHLLVIRQIDDKRDGYGKHAVTEEFSDSIRFDFTTHSASVLDTLKQCGIDNLITVFKLEYPDHNSLRLSNSKAVLSLERW